MREGPRIYNLFPLLAGTVGAWKRDLPRIAEMNFNWVFLNPVHATGFSGSLYAVKDHFTLDPRFRGSARRSDDTLLADFAKAADGRGLEVMIDLVVNHTARDSVLVDQHPDWFSRDERGEIVSPSAVDPDDESIVTVWGDLAEIDYSKRPERDAIVAYWKRLVRHYLDLGFGGFRCDAAYKVPASVWREIIEDARSVEPGVVFAAETLGCRVEQVEALASAGFDYLFNSAKWWDFEAPWLLEQYDRFRHIAPSIAFPESHDTERLATDLIAAGIADLDSIEAVYRQRYLFSALFSTGVMMPIGYEFGWTKRLNVVETRPKDRETPRFDLSKDIAAINAWKAETPIVNWEAPQEQVATGSDGAVALLRRGSAEDDWLLAIVNRSTEADVRLRASGAVEVFRRIRDGKDVSPLGAREADAPTGWISLPPASIKVYRGSVDARAEAFGVAPAAEATMPLEARAMRSRPVVIQNVYPELDGGRFPVKREVGDTLDVWADIFREGHDKSGAALLYRTIDEDSWRQVPMRLMEPGLDRWNARVPLERNTRYLYTIEAWPDPFATWRSELQKKRAAGQDVSLELIEGRKLVADALTRVEGDDRGGAERVLADVDAATDMDDKAEILLSPLLERIMGRWPDRSAAVRYDRTLEVVVDRVRARFAAWYEMFPRSQGTDPDRSATFDDCIRRLPEIAEMGFDVVYLPPIHPIGRTHRKGPDNTLNAGPDDPGSPYAIGSEEGGHTAVHPDLGTLDDFRRFIAAAGEHGMEIALDFAIQCSPDHPWIKEHPEWFNFRPDGTIKYAENPPKKYQDIVNVNFFGAHQAALWDELRDVILFWVDQGVKTFRVDNPHTKPIPFWEWMIEEVQAKHPDVIFLSEAFTRPRVLEMLAKVGFTQSYTYFTWRNFKPELTDYLTELTRHEPKEYLRPNFFANTPDILPAFLQTGGRPAFQIRLVLAATLSSVYGIYNGFELCENAAVPGTEEYLHSEKYQYKVWDWDRPGHIKDYIARVNRVRRENPALHKLLNLFYLDAEDDSILFYGKMTPDRRNMVFVAVNLDPFETHEADIVFPLWDMGVPEDETYEVEELLSGDKHLWRGARQHVRLAPATNPAAIFRVIPWRHVDYREPCF